MHWLAWWKLCIPKISGSMGFQDLHYFNLNGTETILVVYETF